MLVANWGVVVICRSRLRLGGGCWADEGGIEEDYVGWKQKEVG